LSHPQTLDVNEFEIIEVEYKNRMKAKDIQKKVLCKKGELSKYSL